MQGTNSATTGWHAVLPQAPFSNDEARAVSWLSRSGGAPWMSPEVWTLLVNRLGARDRSSRLAGLISGAWLVSWIVVVATTGWFFGKPWIFVGFAASVGLIGFVGAELDRRLHVREELALVSSGAIRVTRGDVPSARAYIGTPRFVGAGVVAAIHIVIVVYLLLSGRVQLAAAVAIVLGVAWAAGVLVLLRAMRRPTVAIDEISLAIDERLRAGEAIKALDLTFASSGCAVLLIPIGGQADAIAGLLAVAAMVIGTLSAKERRWRPLPRSGHLVWSRS